MRTAIVTDTNSGISRAEAEKMGVFLISMPVIIEEEVYFEGDTISEKAFYQALCSGRKVTTSMPSPGALTELWETVLAKGYEELVYIPMSSGLSNSCAAAAALARDYEGRVLVADNHRISVTLKDSVASAQRMARKGVSGKEIKDFLERDAYNASIYIAVDTLEYLKKGGRITPAGAALASALKIKPILTIQGEKLDSFSKARGMKKALHIMAEALKKERDTRFACVEQESLHLAIAGTLLSDQEIHHAKEALEAVFPGYETDYTPLSLSIGCHVGPRAVGMGLVCITA